MSDIQTAKLETLDYLVDALMEGRGFKLGEPWKAKETLAAVVPILVEEILGMREYVLVEEVKEKVKILDTGSIGRLSVVSGVDKPVFFRSGTVLEGKGTQSRAVESSVIAEPEKPVEIPVKCVHASHPISTSAGFKVVASAPLRVHRALYSRSQAKVWGSVGAFNLSMRTASSGTGHRSTRHSASVEEVATLSGLSDSLVATISSGTNYSKMMDKFIREIPAFETQVGIVVLDREGVVGLELFEHPDSWKAASEGVIKKYGEVFSKPAKTAFTLELDPARVREVVNGFLSKLKGLPHPVEKKDGTYSLGVEVTGEYTILHKLVIHLIAFRREAEKEDTTPISLNLLYTPSETPVYQQETGTTPFTSATPEPTTSMTLNWQHLAAKRKRKILTSGWDYTTANLLSSLANKEFEGDKSKAIRTLVKNGLEKKGYT